MAGTARTLKSLQSSTSIIPLSVQYAGLAGLASLALTFGWASWITTQFSPTSISVPSLSWLGSIEIGLDHEFETTEQPILISQAKAEPVAPKVFAPAKKAAKKKSHPKTIVARKMEAAAPIVEMIDDLVEPTPVKEEVASVDELAALGRLHSEMSERFHTVVNTQFDIESLVIQVAEVDPIPAEMAIHSEPVVMVAKAPKAPKPQKKQVHLVAAAPLQKAKKQEEKKVEPVRAEAPVAEKAEELLAYGPTIQDAILTTPTAPIKVAEPAILEAEVQKPLNTQVKVSPPVQVAQADLPQIQIKAPPAKAEIPSEKQTPVPAKPEAPRTVLTPDRPARLDIAPSWEVDTHVPAVQPARATEYSYLVDDVVTQQAHEMATQPQAPAPVAAPVIVSPTTKSTIFIQRPSQEGTPPRGVPAVQPGPRFPAPATPGTDLNPINFAALMPSNVKEEQSGFSPAAPAVPAPEKKIFALDGGPTEPERAPVAVEAFDWHSEVSGASQETVSYDGVSEGSVAQWLISRAEGHWPTISWSGGGVASVPLISENSAALLSKMSGSGTLQQSSGIVFGYVPKGWRVEFSGRSDEAIYFDRKPEVDRDAALGLPEGGRYFALVNAEPGAHLLYLVPVVGIERMAIVTPVMEGKATFVASQKAPEKKNITGFVFSAAQKRPTGVADITVSIVGQANKTSFTGAGGFFAVSDVMSLPGYPLFIETSGAEIYTHRYRIASGASTPLSLYQLSNSQLKGWLDQLEGGVAEDSALVVAALPNTVKNSKEKLFPYVGSLSSHPEMTPETYSLSGKDHLTIDTPMQGDSPRFLSVQVPGGPAVVSLHSQDGKRTAFSEMIFSSPKVINVVGPDF
ncbi:hypothetical protein K2X30_01650 [bacterium]|nr:hypothetical protein [bacterium]